MIRKFIIIFIVIIDKFYTKLLKKTYMRSKNLLCDSKIKIIYKT